MTETKLKELSASAVKANVAVLEDLFLRANLKMDWIDSSYSVREAQLVDVAIATLARYGNTVLLSDVFEAEEMEYGNNWDARQMRAMTELYAIWVDKTAIISRKDNLLNAPDMINPHWKAMFNHELAKLIITKGKLMGYHRSTYGWEDFEQYLGVGRKSASVVAVFNVKEDHWGEFSGTFVTDDDSRTGFTAHVMYADGTFRDLRYEATLADVMKELG
jgi:hypothetical protein